MNRRNTARRPELLLTAAAVAGLVALAAPATRRDDSGPRYRPDGAGVAYVESSSGLTPPSLDGGRTELEMGDVDGDGRLDLVSVGDHGSPHVGTDQHGVMVWFGDGAGAWTVRMVGDFGYGGVALGDVDGDGWLDVGYGIHHNYSGQDLGDQILEVALGDGSGLAWLPWDDGLATNGESWGMSATDFADVDGDGDLDLGAVSFGCCAGVHVYLNRGDGSWQQSFGFVGGNSGGQCVFGDVNRDGSPDMVVSHELGTVYLGDGNGGYSLADGNLPSPMSFGLAGVSLGDVDHDGADDLSFCNDAGGVEVWSMTGPAAWTDLSGTLPANGSCEATQLADMDRDGHLDVVAFGNGQLQIFRGDGAGSWTRAVSFTTPSPGNMKAFRVGGDFDHNGYPDIALVADEGSWPNGSSHGHVFRESSTPVDLAITPVHPDGFEVVRAGSVVFIDWLTAVPPGDTGTVTLELADQGASGPWRTIGEALPDSGRFQWRIPLDTPSSDDAHLRLTVVTASASAVAVNAAPFSILGSVVGPTIADGIETGGATVPITPGP